MALSPLIPVANADSAFYWESAAKDRLVLRKCKACGATHFMPRYMCPTCWSTDLEWIDASGAGVVHSYSIIHRASAPEFRDRVPYVLAMIDLAEGVQMITNIVGDDALSVQIGDPVQVCFEARGETAKVPQFQRVGGSGSGSGSGASSNSAAASGGAPK